MQGRTLGPALKLVAAGGAGAAGQGLVERDALSKLSTMLHLRPEEYILVGEQPLAAGGVVCGRGATSLPAAVAPPRRRATRAAPRLRRSRNRKRPLVPRGARRGSKSMGRARWTERWATAEWQRRVQARESSRSRVAWRPCPRTASFVGARKQRQAPRQRARPLLGCGEGCGRCGPSWMRRPLPRKLAGLWLQLGVVALAA